MRSECQGRTQIWSHTYSHSAFDSPLQLSFLYHTLDQHSRLPQAITIYDFFFFSLLCFPSSFFYLSKEDRLSLIAAWVAGLHEWCLSVYLYHSLFSLLLTQTPKSFSTQFFFLLLLILLLTYAPPLLPTRNLTLIINPIQISFFFNFLHSYPLQII